MVTAVAQAGDLDRAYRLAADAEAVASSIADPDNRAPGAVDCVAAVAQAGDLDRAEALARAITRLDEPDRGARRPGLCGRAGR